MLGSIARRSVVAVQPAFRNEDPGATRVHSAIAIAACNGMIMYRINVSRRGETFVDGLPRSTLRDLKRKLTFVPAREARTAGRSSGDGTTRRPP
jgi:hypothetical protein